MVIERRKTYVFVMEIFFFNVWIYLSSATFFSSVSAIIKGLMMADTKSRKILWKVNERIAFRVLCSF